MIGKFVQTYFAVEDNVIDKKLIKFVNEKTFTSKKNVKDIIVKILESYAEKFCNSDINAAKKELTSTVSMFSNKDSAFIGFFSGMIVIMSISIFFTTTLHPLPSIVYNWDMILNNLPPYRFLLLFIAAIYMASITMYIWNRSKVNYPFIFDMDVSYKISPVDVLRVSTMLLTLWIVCFFSDLERVVLEQTLNIRAAFPLVFLYVFFAILFFAPLKIFYSKARW
jgi:hypothetical protein